MASPTEVCNEALGLIGEDPIAALDDGSRNANRCNTFFPTTRDDVLRRHPWNFAHKQAILAQDDPAAPLFDFTYSYTLPTDCLRVLKVNQSEETIWKVYGRKIFTDESVCEIDYTARIEDPTVWDAIFFQAITHMLASKLAASIKQDTKMQAGMYTVYQTICHEAMATDSQEQSQENFDTPFLVAVRGG